MTTTKDELRKLFDSLFKTIANHQKEMDQMSKYSKKTLLKLSDSCYGFINGALLKSNPEVVKDPYLAIFLVLRLIEEWADNFKTVNNGFVDLTELFEILKRNIDNYNISPWTVDKICSCIFDWLDRYEFQTKDYTHMSVIHMILGQLELKKPSDKESYALFCSKRGLENIRFEFEKKNLFALMKELERKSTNELIYLLLRNLKVMFSEKRPYPLWFQQHRITRLTEGLYIWLTRIIPDYEWLITPICDSFFSFDFPDQETLKSDLKRRLETYASATGSEGQEEVTNYYY